MPAIKEDVRSLALAPGTQVTTRCGALFLFLPHLVRLRLDELASRASCRAPG